MKSSQFTAACTILALIDCGSGFSPKRRNTRSQTRVAPCAAVRIEGYDEAFGIIDQCAIAGEPSKHLYDAVRHIDRNALKIYPGQDEKDALWERAHGSWKLQLGAGGGKYRTFKPVPVFAFAMVDEVNFGNGVGFGESNIVLSLLGPHSFNVKRRQMVIAIDDLYLFGAKVTNKVPRFIGDGMGLGKSPEDMKRPPAFTFIGASDSALIARGGTGGIAIWKRISDDIRPAAYG